MGDFWQQLLCYTQEQARGVSITEIILIWLAGTIMLHLAILVGTRFSNLQVGLKSEMLWSVIILYASFMGQITILQRSPGTDSVVYLDLYLGSLLGDYFSVQQFYYSLLNILLFVPWGFLLGINRRTTKTGIRIFMISCYSFLTSVFIECVQYITQRGHFEINDMVTNTIGGLLGSILASIVISFTKGRKLGHERQQG